MVSIRVARLSEIWPTVKKLDPSKFQLDTSPRETSCRLAATAVMASPYLSDGGYANTLQRGRQPRSASLKFDDRM